MFGYLIVPTVILFLVREAVAASTNSTKVQEGDMITVSFQYPNDSVASSRIWLSIGPKGVHPPKFISMCGLTEPCNTTVGEASVQFFSNSLDEMEDLDVTYLADDGLKIRTRPINFNINFCSKANARIVDITHELPVAGSELSKIAFGSCFWPGAQASDLLWKHMRQTYSPDLWMWLGDNMYADGMDMNAKRIAYNNARKDPYYSTYGPVADPKIPTMATWDDHDSASNNNGNNYRCFKESQNEFVAHFSLPPSDPRHPAQGEQQQKGVYSANMFSRPAQFGGGNGVHAILLDARTARDPTYSIYGRCKRENSRMLSDEQWAWFDNELSKESIIKIIASGVQVLPPTDLITTPVRTYCSYDGRGGTFDKAISDVGENKRSRGTIYETWSHFPQERAKLLQKCQKAINNGKAKQIIFLSGDQHWAEIMAKRMPESPEFGPSVVLHEITASGIDQKWIAPIFNANRLKIRTADFRGNGVFDMECNFPFIYRGVKYNECTTVDAKRPWCSTRTTSWDLHIIGRWGYCIDESEELIQEGQFSGKHTCTDQLSHICAAQANYGAVTVDWSSEKIKLSVFTPHSDIAEAASHTISFRN